MPYRDKIAAGKEIQLSHDYKATVRALKADEEDEVQALYLGSRKTKANAQTVNKVTTTSVAIEADNPVLMRETLLRGIVKWDLDGDPVKDEGHMDSKGILLITERNLKELSGGDRNLLFKTINDLTEPPDDKEKKDSVTD
jgi:hypothetical protein